jgi:uncharacterized protein YjdB
MDYQERDLLPVLEPFHTRFSSNADGRTMLKTKLVVCQPTTRVLRTAAAAVALIALALSLAGCGSGAQSTPIPSVTLVSIAVTATNQSIPVNGTQQFAATGTYSDGSSKSLTSLAVWSSTATSVATVSSSGLATGVASGVAGIQAAMGSVSGSKNLTVTPILSSITVAPASPSAVVNTNAQFSATGILSDGSAQDLTAQVAWASSAPGIASIDSAGLATGVAAGSTTISAGLGTITGSTVLTVNAPTLTSIVITPDQNSVPQGIGQPFVATGIFNNGATQNLASASWSSSDATVAAIDSSGTATTLGVGTITISATSGSVTGSTSFTVLPAALVSIDLTPPNPSLALGTTVQLTAVGTFTDGSTQILSTVTWNSSDTTIASVDANGLATSLATGSVTISGLSGSINVNITLAVTPAVVASIAIAPLGPSIPAGTVQQFTATGTFTDASSQDITGVATWNSSAPNVATISNSGLASALVAGSSTITASLGSVSNSTALTVGPATLQSITANPQNPLMGTGTTAQFTATGHYSDASTQDLTALAAWTSSDATVASVDSAGVVSARKAGTATITAALGSVNGSTTLTVANHTLQLIVVTPVNPSVNNGQTQQFTATGYFADGTTQDLTASRTGVPHLAAWRLSTMV